MPIFAAAAILFQSPAAEAEIYRGMAAIVNGDINKAQREAREDAMRACVEEKLGARVSSRTEVSMGMVVSDKIMVNADGYVRPKGAPKFSESGGVVICEIDIEANSQRIVAEYDDVKSQIENAVNADTTGRSHIVVAVSGRDENGFLQNDANTNDITNYVRDSMVTQGFTAHAPDEIVYAIAGKDFDKPVERAEARREVRNAMSEVNGILRGSLSTIKVQKNGGAWTATVKATFELVGIVSSEVNSFTDYFTAANMDRDMALMKAANSRRGNRQTSRRNISGRNKGRRPAYAGCNRN